VLVFGRGRVSKRFYLFAAIMVNVGAIFSSVWITVANSWQQTPDGSHIVQMTRPNPETGVQEPWFIDGDPVLRAEIVDFWRVVFNPSTMHRLTHVWTGCFILGGGFVLSVCAWYVLRKRHVEFARRCMPAALVVTFIGTLTAAITGDANARMVAEHQPAKLAAMEAHLETGDGPAGLVLFGLPDADGENLRAKVEIPGLLSTFVHHEFPGKTPVIGMDRIRPQDRPPVGIPFFAFRLMVISGVLLLIVSGLALLFWWRGTLMGKRWLMRVLVASVFGGFVANEAGWVTAEVGRQPWIVYPPLVRDAAGEPVLDAEGYVQHEMLEFPTEDGSATKTVVAGLRTGVAVSERVPAGEVLASIILFGLIYGLLFLVWAFVLDRKIGHGPEADSAPDDQAGGFVAAVVGASGGSLTETESAERSP
jgi:cytochrome d ubiquinol oxidase subunit I